MPKLKAKESVTVAATKRTPQEVQEESNRVLWEIGLCTVQSEEYENKIQELDRKIGQLKEKADKLRKEFGELHQEVKP